MFSELWRRLEFLLRRRRFDEDLVEEMRLHLDLRTAEEGSETAARVRFGNERPVAASSPEMVEMSSGNARGAAGRFDS